MLTPEKLPIGTLVGNTTSRTNGNYVFLDHITQDNYLEVWRPPTFPVNIQSVSKQYIIPYQYQLRADLISQKFYSTPVMAWAICYYNSILDPFDPIDGLYTGRVINVINLDYLTQGK